MTFALASVSHSPMLGRVDPGGTIYDEILAAIDRVKTFVKEFNPEVVVSFGPDHFNGVLYEMMPTFAIGAQAVGVGDWGTVEGPLPVDSETARALHRGVLERDVDCPLSERLRVDHGMLQTVEFIFGEAGIRKPFVPVFVNALGVPLSPMRRIRVFGEALGAAALELDKRVLFLSSGGLSHDPPVPIFLESERPVQERLTSAEVTLEMRQAREAQILAAAKRRASAEGVAMKPANEEWDRELLRVFASNELTQADAWTHEWMVEEGGSAAEEMRAWLAAFAALSAGGRYDMVEENYWASEPWGGGFGVVTARSA